MTDDNESTDEEFSRRTVMQATGAVAGAGMLGVGATGTAAAHEGFHAEFANFRVREAEKVWNRGYRGRPDRSIALTDTGIDARHPDVGPWNGVQAVVDDGELKLTGPELQDREREKTGRTLTFTGSAGPGTFVTSDEFVAGTFVNDGGDQNDSGADELDAELHWSPWVQDTNDLELKLEIKVDEGTWEEVATAASSSNPEVMRGVQLDAGAEYRFKVVQFHNVASNYEINVTFFDYTADLETYDESDLFDDTGEPKQLLSDPGSTATPKVIGWFNEASRYGDWEMPRDPNGHGTHVSSIMGGSGRASLPDADALTKDDPRTVLTAGDFLEYEIDGLAGTGVFVSAYGDGIELLIEAPDGRQLDESTVLSEDASTFDNNIAEAPARQDGTYTAYVRPIEGELVSTARVETVRAGRFVDHTQTSADRDPGDPAVHSGLAPDASLLGLQGLSSPTEDLARFADTFADVFNVRAVNMSWGYIGGLPFGAFGDTVGFGIVEAVKKIAEAGILTVAAAGNAYTPANGNGAPAVADEAVSVAATGPLDGLTSYSAGGIGAIDEDGGTYMKPDVTAPGGYDNNEVDAAGAAVKPGGGVKTGPTQGEVRGYVVKAGTSMASPFVNGVVGLVAQAMEEDAPESVALPAPAEAGIDDVKRLKQVVLATATETVFTAAPYHRAHAPTYDHGGRDPYEGFGRVNPDAAVDAVSRDLLPGTADVDPNEAISDSHEAVVGLNVPEDSRAVAGFVEAADGTLDASVDVSHLSGGNKGMAKGAPHVDLFVYDAENPADNGEPNVVASAMGEEGAAGASVDVATGDGEETHVYYVVAKLVNVPGVVNGFDVHAHLDLDVEFTAAPLPAFEATGTREDDASVFTGGQTDRMVLTVGEITELAGADEVAVTDAIPEEWTFLQGRVIDEDWNEISTDVTTDGTTVFFPTFSVQELRNNDYRFVYYVEVPQGVKQTGEYTFGPGVLELVTDAPVSNEKDAFAGTDTNVVVGASTDTDL